MEIEVTKRHQIVIPREVVESLRVKPGDKVMVMNVGERIAIVPSRPISESRGSLPGLDTTVPREDRDL